MKKALSYTSTSFDGYNSFGCIYILLTFKNKKKKICLPILIFWRYVLEWYSLDFCKKPRNVHFDLNSIFSLSYKISFADLRSLFMERITNVDDDSIFIDACRSCRVSSWSLSKEGETFVESYEIECEYRWMK